MKKESLEVLNSILWFTMDAMWMFELGFLGAILSIPTIGTGVWICALEKERDIWWVDLAMLFWMGMNAGWLISDSFGYEPFLVAAKVFFTAGALALVFAVSVSDDWRSTLRKFKRVRFGGSRPSTLSQ